MGPETPIAFRPIAAFLGLTFGLTWALWATLGIPAVGGSPSLALIVMTPGMWIPSLCALFLTRWQLCESWRTTTLDRLGQKRYYLWAWLLPPTGTLASMLLTVGFGIARFDPDFTWLHEQVEKAGRPMPVPVWVFVGAQALTGLTLGPLFNMLFAVGEEIGWRGFLLPRLLRAGLGQWSALLASGAIWGFWHAPVILLVGHNYPDHPYLGVLLNTACFALLGVIFGWLQLASGSVWVRTPRPMPLVGYPFFF